METVRFTIYRKKALSGLFLLHSVYINGVLVGKIKNGRALAVEVPKAALYDLTGLVWGCDVDPFDENNAVLRDCGCSEYRVLLKRVGGRRTNPRCRFDLCTGEQTVPLPAFHFEKFEDAVWGDRIQELPASERFLAICAEFWFGITDDLQEVLASEYLTEILDALQEIGATQLAGTLRRILDEWFADVALPLNDDQIEQLSDRIRKANKWIWKLPEPAWEEFHAGVAKYIAANLNSEEYIY